MSALNCLYGPPFNLVGETFPANNSFSFAVEFDSMADQGSVLAYQWFLDQAILIDEQLQQISSEVANGSHLIGVRILTHEGWSAVKHKEFFIGILSGSLSIQGPTEVLEGEVAAYDSYLTLTDGTLLKVTSKTTFNIDLGGTFDFNLLSTIRDDIDFNDKYAVITAELQGGLTQTLPITIVNTSVKYPSVLVVDLFDDSALNAVGVIVNPEIAWALLPAYTGSNFMPSGSSAADAYILASDLVGNGGSLKWRFEFNIKKLIQQYPTIPDFVLEIRAKSNIAKNLYGAFSLKDFDGSMVMNGITGSFIPSVAGGSNLYFSNFQTFVGGGANGNYNVGNLPMALRFTFNVATETISYIGASNLFYSDAISDFVAKNDCPSGYSGSLVNYSLPQGAFSSNISKQDANNMAVNYFNAYKQEYANANGTCEIVSEYVFISMEAVALVPQTGPTNRWFFKIVSSAALTEDVNVVFYCTYEAPSGNNVGQYNGTFTLPAGSLEYLDNGFMLDTSPAGGIINIGIIDGNPAPGATVTEADTGLQKIISYY